MKQLLTIFLSLFLFVQTAFAGRVVMSYTDSRGGTGGTTSYPALLDTARTDFTVCNRFHDGWTSVDALNNVASEIAICAATGELTDVAIMFGVNDAIYVGGTSLFVAMRLLAIADAIEAAGVRAWIILELPGPYDWGAGGGSGFSVDARKWTRGNVEAVLRLGTGYRTINLRDELLLNYKVNGAVVPGHWYKSASNDNWACSDDKLHPTLLGCRQNFANLFAVTIP